MADDDPLQDPAYMRSVAETIADSHHSSATAAHDLLDAYVTLTNRLRAHSSRLEACNGALLPALAPLQIRRDNITRALRRDICLAHYDPLSSVSYSCHELALARGIRVDTKQQARDSSSLCHHALCVLATIFRFPALHSLFPERDLSTLFGDVLDIALADQLPILNRAKTSSLSLWILSSHRLPVTVVDSRKDDVFAAIQRCFGDARQPDDVILDGLRAISHMTECYGHRVLDFLFPLLPHVIANLRCGSCELRLQASVTLGKCAKVLIHRVDLSLSKWQSLSNHIAPSLESFCLESHTDYENPSFLSIIRATLSESPAHLCEAPTWVLAVLASWIVLCGPTLYNRPTVLRFILQVLAMTLTHKRAVVRALHPHVWRCFVWTFSRMLLSSENVQSSLISSAFCMIKQEVTAGIGIALASVLVSDQVSAVRSEVRADRLCQALSVIKAMVQANCKHTRQEGFVLLRALTEGTPVEHPVLQNAYEMPASILLDGAIIGVEWDSISSIIHSIPKVPVSVYRLEETEMARHYETLLAIWKHIAMNDDMKEFCPDLVGVWLSMLSARSRQFGYEIHIAPETTLMYTAAIIVEFLPSAIITDSQSNWGSWNVRDQVFSLTFIHQLWSAMQCAFVAFSLADAAASVLIPILKYPFHVLDFDVRTLWSKLCANLMITTPRSFLLGMQDYTAPQSFIRNQRELWGVVAASLPSSESGLHWKKIIKFLSIPVCTWVLSEPELGAWNSLLQSAIASSGDSIQVIEYLVLQHLQGTEIDTWGSIIAVLNLLLSSTHEYGNPPTGGLLSMVNVCLSASYSRACQSPGALTHSLELLNGICRVITSAPDKALYILQALRESLCIWIEDRAEVMSDDQFNSVVVSLYCKTLKILEGLPLSIQFLQDMEAFLASAFCRIPTPAMAPFAFEKFWRATYHGQRQFCDILPPKIKSCLVCFVAAYGGDLCDGLSITTESQESQNISDCCRADHQGQGSDGPSLASENNSTRPEMSVNNLALHSPPQTFRSQVAASPVYSLGGDASQPAVLRQLQEYSSGLDPSSLDDSEQPMSDPRSLLLPVFSPRHPTPGSHSCKRIVATTSYASNKKRTLIDNGETPQKRSRLSRDTLRSLRQLASEPATRDATPVDIPRTRSVPPKRTVFDGVHVPTLREVLSRKLRSAQNEAVDDTFRTPLRVYPSRGTQPRDRTPASDGDSFDWENCRVSTASSVDVEPSLVDVLPASSPLSRTSSVGGSSDHPSEGSLARVESPSESPPDRPSSSLQRTKTKSARLDALRDVYSSVANGASQIPMSELLQATKLVHQIGAVLTEQMGRKMDGPAG